MLPKNNETKTYASSGSNGGVARLLTQEGISIPQLRTAINGRVIAPDDPW